MKRLRSKRGETIAETLIALLISCVALIMLANMIDSGSRLVMDSEDRMDEYYSQNNGIAAGNSDEAGDSGSAKITITKDNSSGTSTTIKEVDVNYYINNSLGNTSVVAYKEKDS